MDLINRLTGIKSSIPSARLRRGQSTEVIDSFRYNRQMPPLTTIDAVLMNAIIEGDRCVNAGNIGGAMNAYTNGINQANNYPGSENNSLYREISIKLSNVYLNHGDFDEAVETLKTAVNTETPYGLFNLFYARTLAERAFFTQDMAPKKQDLDEAAKQLVLGYTGGIPKNRLPDFFDYVHDVYSELVGLEPLGPQNTNHQVDLRTCMEKAFDWSMKPENGKPWDKSQLKMDLNRTLGLIYSTDEAYQSNRFTPSSIEESMNDAANSTSMYTSGPLTRAMADGIREINPDVKKQLDNITTRRTWDVIIDATHQLRKSRDSDDPYISLDATRVLRELHGRLANYFAVKK